MHLRIDKKSMFSIMFSFFVFMSINLPTIKFLYSSSLLNIVALIGVLCFGLFRWIVSNEPMLNIDKRQLKFIFSFVLLWQIIFSVTWLNNSVHFGATDLFQYLSVILFTFGVLIFLRKEDLKFIVLYQITWGTMFAFLEWTVGIPKNRELGQTYLTAGVVIAATIVVVIGLLFSKDIKIFFKVLLLPILIVLFGGITSLSGRAPILLSLGVPVFVYILSILFEKNLGKKIISLILFTAILISGSILVINALPATTVNRILRIFVDIQSEPRYEVYEYAVTIISENPLGIGLRGYRDYDTGYPHNIILEIAMSGGLISLIPFSAIIITKFKTAIEIAKEKNNNLVWFNLSLYYFLTWNISFDLSSSYMLFISVALLVKSQSLYNLTYVEDNYSIFIEKNWLRDQIFQYGNNSNLKYTGKE